MTTSTYEINSPLKPSFARGTVNDKDIVSVVLRNGETHTGVATVTELRNVTVLSINQDGIGGIINHTSDYVPDDYDVVEIRHTPYGQSGEYAFRYDETGAIGVYQNYVCVLMLPSNFTVEDAKKKLQKAERHINKCKESIDPECQQSVQYHRSVMKASMYSGLIEWMQQRATHEFNG